MLPLGLVTSTVLCTVHCIASSCTTLMMCQHNCQHNCEEQQRAAWLHTSGCRLQLPALLAQSLDLLMLSWLHGWCICRMAAMTLLMRVQLWFRP